MDNKMTTTAIALAFSKSEEIGAVRSTVAWTMAACDLILGWNSTPVKGGKEAVIKQLRELHGYRKDTDGNPIFNDKGQKVKRSAIFARLSLVADVIAYLLKHGRDHIQALNDAAVSDDGDKMQETVERVASELTTLCGDDTIDALSHFLKTGKAKDKAEETATATDAATDAAGSDAAGSDAAGSDPVSALADAVARSMNYGDIVAWIYAHGADMPDHEFRAIQGAVEFMESKRNMEKAQALADAA